MCLGEARATNKLQSLSIHAKLSFRLQLLSLSVTKLEHSAPVLSSCPMSLVWQSSSPMSLRALLRPDCEASVQWKNFHFVDLGDLLYLPDRRMCGCHQSRFMHGLGIIMGCCQQLFGHGLIALSQACSVAGQRWSVKNGTCCQYCCVSQPQQVRMEHLGHFSSIFTEDDFLFSCDLKSAYFSR